MADGVAITAGSGTTVATDDAGAAGHVQIFKLAVSADGSATLIPGDAANGMDVDVTREPATAADNAASLPAVVKVVAGWDGTNVQALAVDSSGNAQVEVINSPTVVVTGTADVDVNSMPTGQGKTLKFASVSTASSGDTSIVAAVTGMKIKLVSYVLVATTAVSVRWYSGAAGTALSGAMPFGATGGASVVGQPSSHLMETAVNTALVLNLSAAVQVSGHISYFEEA